MACVLVVASLLEVVSQMGLVACALAGASLHWVVSQIGLVACVRVRKIRDSFPQINKCYYSYK